MKNTNALLNPSPNTEAGKPPYPPPAKFVAWLEADPGRAQYFSKVDPGLFPSTISKMKYGLIPITFEYAYRLERAQKPSDTPLKAGELMTFIQHQALYRYVTGQEPAPTLEQAEAQQQAA